MILQDLAVWVSFGARAARSVLGTAPRTAIAPSRRRDPFAGPGGTIPSPLRGLVPRGRVRAEHRGGNDVEERFRGDASPGGTAATGRPHVHHPARLYPGRHLLTGLESPPRRKRRDHRVDRKPRRHPFASELPPGDAFPMPPRRPRGGGRFLRPNPRSSRRLTGATACSAGSTFLTGIDWSAPIRRAFPTLPGRSEASQAARPRPVLASPS